MTGPRTHRRLVIYALSLVLRLGWPTTTADVDRDDLPERTAPAAQEPVRLRCDVLEIGDAVTARILAALGRPVACTPRAVLPVHRQDH